MIEQLFSQLGLTSVDATVYEQLLKLKMATPSALARTTKVSRENVYYVLKKLSDQGLVVQIPERKQLTYQVAEPEHLVRLFDQKEQELTTSKNSLQEIIHTIERQRQGKDFKPAVRYYEDITGMKQAFYDFLGGKKKGEIVGFVNYEWPQALQSFFVDERLKHKMQLKLLIVATEKSKLTRNTNPHELRETRIMPQDDFPAGTYIAVLEDRVMMVNRPPAADISGVGIVIEHAPIASAFRAMFSMVWNLSVQV